MSRKLLITTLVIIAVAVLTLLFDNPKSSRKSTATGKTLFPGIMSSKINEIRFRNQKEEAILQKNENGVWFVIEENFFINSQKLFSKLEELSEIKLADLITTDPKKHRLFGVAKSENKFIAYRVEDQELLTIFVGNERSSAGRAGGIYVRKGGDDRVYLVKENILISSDPTYWLNKRFINFNPEQIRSIVIETGDSEIHLLKGQEGDKIFTLKNVDQDQSADTVKINSIPGFFAPFRISEFSKRHLYEFQPNGAVIKLETNEDKIIFSFGQKEKKQEISEEGRLLMIKVESSGTFSTLKSLIEGKIFVYEEWRYKDLVSPKSAFLKSP